MLTLGFFLGTFFAPLTVLTLHGLPSRQLIRAAEEAALLRIAAGAFGITLQGVILYRRHLFINSIWRIFLGEGGSLPSIWCNNSPASWKTPASVRAW